MLKQAFELWITPEFERRKSAGLIGSDFVLQSAQVLFPDDGAPKVRFNEEVKGFLQVRTARAVQKGQPVFADDIADFVGLDLLEEDLNFGHFTLIEHHDNWVILFDFNRNKQHASELVAEQFTNVAAHCFANGYFGPFIDNLFSACELLAKARLITTVLKRGSAQTHGHIHSTINSWRKLGNVGSEFVDLFNELSRARVPARYTGQASNAAFDASHVELTRKEIAILRSRFLPKIEAQEAAQNT